MSFHVKQEVDMLYQYTNGFAFAFNKEKDEIIIRFYQRIPVFKPKNSVEEEDVVALIMNKECAKNLLQALNTVYKDNPEVKANE